MIKIQLGVIERQTFIFLQSVCGLNTDDVYEVPIKLGIPQKIKLLYMYNNILHQKRKNSSILILCFIHYNLLFR